MYAISWIGSKIIKFTFWVERFFGWAERDAMYKNNVIVLERDYVWALENNRELGKNVAGCHYLDKSVCDKCSICEGVILDKFRKMTKKMTCFLVLLYMYENIPIRSEILT